ncbi:tautomerase family protein [Cytobacillus purgationiresistens]|uniref:4-oxalocrotonate tautomerase n=1 Tax=Cytobacillus purgationiresistens TaxID=863449 RepID=A0ABU0ANQ5_9BACI|nr:tautomerase family protein [Cytobacillus purgationiresistens]MDQ0272361.1 4-oxalocrotonate tautomerase [Cytobacillus purgationiresistens]
MPYITIKLTEGRTLDQKRFLVNSVTDSIVNSLGVTPDFVRIELVELKKDIFAVGGELVCDFGRSDLKEEE